MASGALRLGYAAVYTFLLGFGLAMGAELHQKFTGSAIVGFQDYTCKDSHDPDGPWWQQTPSQFWGEEYK
jgi:hypothetical protein